MFSSSAFERAAILMLASGLAAPAQTLNHKIDLSKDSPVTLVSTDWGESRATPRGSAYQVDVHAALSLRNSSQKRIRGVTLAVIAQEITAGGKGAVSVPSLDIAPGDSFSVRVDQSLLRPLGGSDGTPSVEVRLDGVLFDDLSFYGPDKLHSQRSMTVWELEARRDRKYFKALLESAGPEALRKAMLESMTDQGSLAQAQPGVQMGRGHSTNVDTGREVQFAFLNVPESPVEPTSGVARVASNQASGPRFQVRNTSKRPVRYLEIGWIVRDQQGREFLAASLPAELNLAPGQSGEVAPDAALRFSDRTSIQGMKGFISSVEFGDGHYWIPARKALDDLQLGNVVAPSPEEQRLSQIYNKKGLNALMDELKKF